MWLANGSRLGPYEIQAALGAGGMGEVYRARDIRLDRIVAIKILPEALADDPQFRERFDREARTISQLDHPHICALYDVGETPNPEPLHPGAASIRYLVMQYLEGQTLADRLANGQLPPKEALTVAVQIADALDRAHRAGIVHRDLKPGNIMLTRTGAKLLDFGLAKTSASAVGGSLSMLPTTPPNLTEHGTILGTFQYMAPEQVDGQEADARSDIFAFGAVAYEMLTGKKAFEGKTRASVIGAVMHAEPPPISASQPLTPPAIDRIIKKCLAKEPDQRWQSAADLHDSLQWATEELDAPVSQSQASPAPIGALRTGRWRLPWIVAAVFCLSTIAIAAVAYLRRTPADAHAFRASILAPDAAAFANTPAPLRFALSPDGGWIVFAAAGADRRSRLWVRSLDSVTAQPLAGTEGAIGPFWSPDSRFIGFFANGKIKTISASGGPPTTVADASALPGGTWNRDDVILFTAVNLDGLSRVSAKGGQVSSVTKLDAASVESAHLGPFFLPDGRHFLYFSRGRANGGNDVGSYVGSLDSKEPRRRLVAGASVKYAQGYLFFMRDSTLVAQPFNVDRLELTGDAVTVGERVDLGGSTGRAGAFSVSETGVVAYQTATDVRSQLAWFDRTGKQLATIGEPADQVDLDLSPDGTKAVVSLANATGDNRDLWVYDLVRGLRTRFTFGSGDEVCGIWFPDGASIVFSSTGNGTSTLSRKTVNEAGPEDTLLSLQVSGLVSGVSPDGRFVLFANGTPQRNLAFDEWLLPLFGQRKQIAFVQTPFVESGGRFSGDGRWVAYQSNESGQTQVYVTPFPQAGRKWQVSTAGGSFPRWRRDGKELFYVSPDGKLMAATVNGSPAAFEVGIVKPLFDVRFRTVRYPGYNSDRNYDVSADGQRFLVNDAKGEIGPGPITLVGNWLAAARR